MISSAMEGTLTVLEEMEVEEKKGFIKSNVKWSLFFWTSVDL